MRLGRDRQRNELRSLPFESQHHFCFYIPSIAASPRLHVFWEQGRKLQWAKQSESILISRRSLRVHGAITAKGTSTI